MKRILIGVTLSLWLLLSIGFTLAQNELAATLEVLSGGVEVQRVNTANPIQVEVASVVGVGDIVRTNETGEARITFFADGTDTVLKSNTEFRIVAFEEISEEDFLLTIEVIAGQTVQRLERVLGANSTYDVQTPGMTLAARGTEFSIRVEYNGRSAMLVREGTVAAEADESDVAHVPANYGVRAPSDGELSDVVLASTFAQLDAALDGCSASVTTIDDVSINVRTGPSMELDNVGIIADGDIDLFMGVSESGDWYRIPFGDEYGWILSSNARVSSNCAGLRVFEDSWVEGEGAVNIEVEITPEPEG